MSRLGKEVNCGQAADLVVWAQHLEIAGQGGRVTGYIDDPDWGDGSQTIDNLGSATRAGGVYNGNQPVIT